VNCEEYTQELELSRIDTDYYPCLKFSLDCLDHVDNIPDNVMASIYYAKNSTELIRLYLAMRSSTSKWIRDVPSFFMKVENHDAPTHKNRLVCGHCHVTHDYHSVISGLTMLGRFATGNKRASVSCSPCDTFRPLLQTFINRYTEQGRSLPTFKPTTHHLFYTDYD
jgi:hypothetical protein